MTNLRPFFSDMHIHIGSTASGKAVKITASRKMTLQTILEESSERKGMSMVGIIDAHVPEVQQELEELMERGMAHPHPAGGITYKKTMLILGCEVEVKEENRGEAHVLCFVPSLQEMKTFTAWLAERTKNVALSSQRVKTTIRHLQAFLESLGGIVIPAHIFTPHKGLYGSCTNRLADVADPELVFAVELGLSANTDMADQISELHSKTFVTNSDAHSLAKIGREYQSILMAEPCYSEWIRALRRENGRKIEVNYGLHPELGKYHQTECQACQSTQPATDEGRCPQCGYKRVIRGVADRISELADVSRGTHPSHRPPYVNQIPLEYIPGLGPKSRLKLYQAFGTEMDILHTADQDSLAAVIGEKLAELIILARQQQLSLKKGGAGRYGRIERTPSTQS